MNWTPLLIFVAAVIYSPGPNNFTALATATTFGPRSAAWLIAGTECGFILVVLASGFANLYLSSMVPLINKILPPFGAMYLLYLAWKIFVGKGSGQAPRRSPGFFTGFWFQMINPKVVINSLLVMSTYVMPYRQDPWTIVTVALIMTLMSTSSCSLWAFGGRLIRPFLERYDRIYRTFLALTLVWCAYAAIKPWFVQLW